MANPIIHVGNRRDSYSDPDDVISRAQRQDEERRIREDDEHFRRTGENRPPAPEYSPLVEDNPREDVANDGDSYDETMLPFHRQSLDHSAEGEWAEDNPTQLIDPDRPSRRRNFTNELIEDMMSTHGISVGNELNAVRNTTLRNSSQAERVAYFRREQQKEQSIQKELENENRQKYNNAISGLDTDD